jgi:hypothetical protein
MRFLLCLSLFLIFTGCINGDHTSRDYAFPVIRFSDVVFPAFDGDKAVRNEYIKKYFAEHFSIDTLEIIGIALSDEAGSLQIYQYEIKGKGGMDHQGTFLLDSSRHRGIFLPVVGAEIFRAPHDGIYLYGIQLSRAYGYANIYHLCEDSVVQVLSSVNLCDSGLPVRNSSLDCYSYEPYALKQDVRDLNNDGAVDFTYSGSLNSYCEGLEYGFGRLDRQPLKRVPLNIVFESRYLAGDKRYFWQLSDTLVCDIVKK